MLAESVPRRMMSVVLLTTALLVVPSLQAFSVQQRGSYRPAFIVHHQRESCFTSKLFLSEVDDSAVEPDIPPPPPNLVDKDAFVAAIETVTQAKDAEDIRYAIGKLTVILAIDTEPGLELAESTGMVLVSEVSQETADNSGIQLLDTIVEISAANGTFRKSTMEMSLEDTAGTLMSAANHAGEKGVPEIELVLNRLVKLYDAPPAV